MIRPAGVARYPYPHAVRAQLYLCSIIPRRVTAVQQRDAGQMWESVAHQSPGCVRVVHIRSCVARVERLKLPQLRPGPLVEFAYQFIAVVTEPYRRFVDAGYRWAWFGQINYTTSTSTVMAESDDPPRGTADSSPAK